MKMKGGEFTAPEWYAVLLEGSPHGSDPVRALEHNEQVRSDTPDQAGD